MESKKEIMIEIFVVSLILFFWGGGWGSPFVGPSNFIDEGQFGAWINHMSHGEKLFKDIFIVYGPLSVYPLFYLGKVFGPSIFLIREYLTLGAIPGFIGLYLFSKRLQFTRFIRYSMYLVFLLLPVLSMRQSAFIIGLYFLVVSFDKSTLWRYLTGALMTVALLISQEYGIFLFILFVFYSFVKSIDKKKVKYIKIFQILLGTIVSFGLFAFVALFDGWFVQYLKGTIDVIISFSGQNVPNGMGFPGLFDVDKQITGVKSLIKIFFDNNRMYYYSLMVYLVSIEYLSVGFITKKIKNWHREIFFITISGLLILPSLITRPGIANFFGLIWPILLILFYFINSLIQGIKAKQKNNTKKIGSYILLILSVLFIVRLISLYRPNIYTRARDVTKIPQILNKGIGNPLIGLMDLGSAQTKEVDKMKEILNKYSKKGDYVFFFNDEPMYYMLFDRRNPTRYDLPFAANYIEKRYELLNSLKINNTKLVILDKNVWAVDGIDNTKRLPEAFAFIVKNYERIDIRNTQIVVYIKK